MTVLAHAGSCSRGETGTTLAIGAAAGVLLLQPWRRGSRRRRGGLARLLVPVVIAAAATTGACAPKSRPAATRPSTTARLQIVSPTANEVTGPNVTLRIDLIGARVAQAASGDLRPDEGHIHVSLDGRLVSMTFGLTQDLPNLTPGPHSVRAEFVAVDHAPFRNRVATAVLFTVRP